MTLELRHHPPPLPGARAYRVQALAVSALLGELETWPKPGLVSEVDSGSHRDMNAETFRRSTSAIGPYYKLLASAGAMGVPMEGLRRIGREAEAAMLAATGGINTHRGAIFGLGLLCAAAGAVWSSGRGVVRFKAESVANRVRETWGTDILGGAIPPHSHGGEAFRRFGAGGARFQAAAGFPQVTALGLPALRMGRALAPGDPQASRVQAFFALMGALEDTNLLHRGGLAGLRYAQQAAADFIRQGGVGQPDWRLQAAQLHRAFVSRNLSPGGSADLLAMTLFLDALEGERR